MKGERDERKKKTEMDTADFHVEKRDSEKAGSVSM